MSGTASEMFNSVKETFSQTEKSLRNLHPVLFLMGVIYVSKIDIDKIDVQAKGEWTDYLAWFLLIPVLFGPTVYTAYRVCLELLDYLFVFFMTKRYSPEDSKNSEKFFRLPYRLAMHTNLEYKDADFSGLRNYYSYKFACCHNVMLSSFLFSLWGYCSAWDCGLVWGGVAAFVFALLNYSVLTHRQRISYLKFKPIRNSREDNPTSREDNPTDD